MTVLWPLLVFVVLSYIGLPLVILFSQKMQARPQFVPIDPSNVPPEVTRYFAQIVPQLEQDGFRVTASLGMPRQVPNVQCFIVMLVNRSAGDKAMVTMTQTTSPNAPTKIVPMTEFNTRFDSGESFDTSTMSSPSVFRYGAQETKTRLPGVQDARMLYQIHRWVMAQKRPQGTKIVYKDGEAVEYLSRIMIEDYDKQVRFGRLKLDTSAGVYRPTIIGAYLMTWALLWPIKPIRQALRKSKEAATLRAFRSTQGTAATSF